ncbi:MAG: ABC transporter permease [Micrococcales bacterium]|nr:ABC transporter permease [Micrococcales bacterium]
MKRNKQGPRRPFTPVPLPKGRFDPPNAPTSRQLIAIVAKREAGSLLRSKAFRISTTVIIALVLVAFVVVGVMSSSPSSNEPTSGPAHGPAGLFSSDSGPLEVAADDATALLLADNPNVELTPVADEQEARSLVADGTVAAAALTKADGHYLLIADTTAPEALVVALSTFPEVVLLTPDSYDELQSYLALVLFAVLFVVAASLFGNLIAQRSVVEKQTRIVEILLAGMPARALLAGKVLGITAVAVGQTALLTATVFFGSRVSGVTGVFGDLTLPMLWYIAFFTLGFLLLAAMYAGTASMASRMEDVSAAVMPVVLLIVLPYIFAFSFGLQPTGRAIMSFIPFTAPIAMPFRVLVDSVALWEPLVSLGILAVCAIGLIALAARIYERSILRTGARLKLLQALKGK